MAEWNVGEKNGYWKNGRTVTQHGYVLIRVGKDHHLADVRGYAYEHRLVAEEKLGRRLRPGEQVHHINGDTTDNRPENLKVVLSLKYHRVLHRSSKSRLRKPGEANPIIRCLCGCGTRLRKFDQSGRPRNYVSGHNPPPSPTMSMILDALKDGPVSVGELMKLKPKSRYAIKVCLSKMKGRGLVDNPEHGIWEALDNGKV